ncbi:hypothetical protein TNCV_2454281 [Trichonephila clavipes]|nr:hypothetical protein TNCV_2454281 [Trichonephila clavipes]
MREDCKNADIQWKPGSWNTVGWVRNDDEGIKVVGRSLSQINLGVQGGIHGGSHKQSPDNAHSVAFSQRSSSPCLIEDETFNASDMNNLIDYKDGLKKTRIL